MGRLNKRDWGGGRGGGAHFNMCAETLNPFNIKGDNSGSCIKKTSLYITCLVTFIVLEGLMLDVVCNPVLRCSKQRVEAS